MTHEREEDHRVGVKGAWSFGEHVLNVTRPLSFQFVSGLPETRHKADVEVRVEERWLEMKHEGRIREGGEGERRKFTTALFLARGQKVPRGVRRKAWKEGGRGKALRTLFN